MGERKGHPVVTRGFASSAWCSLFTELFSPLGIFGFRSFGAVDCIQVKNQDQTRDRATLHVASQHRAARAETQKQAPGDAAMEKVRGREEVEK